MVSPLSLSGAGSRGWTLATVGIPSFTVLLGREAGPEMRMILGVPFPVRYSIGKGELPCARPAQIGHSPLLGGDVLEFYPLVSASMSMWSVWTTGRSQWRGCHFGRIASPRISRRGGGRRAGLIMPLATSPSPHQPPMGPYDSPPPSRTCTQNPARGLEITSPRLQSPPARCTARHHEAGDC